MINLDEIKTILEIITQIITIIGVPTAIIVYFLTKRKERREREYLAYDSADDKHIEFLKLCLENADLNIYWGDDVDLKNISIEEYGRRLLLYEILIGNIERAFLLYRNCSNETRKKQWEKGWNQYAKDWMKVNNFRESWDILTEKQYDLDFLKHMNTIYQEAEQQNIPENNNINMNNSKNKN